MSWILLIAKSIFTFIATEIDEFVVFVLLFAKYPEKKSKILIFLGQLFALTLIIFVCAYVAKILSGIPFKYLRFVGFVPIALGIYSAAESIINHFKHKSEEKTTNISKTGILLLVATFLLTLSTCGDNLGIYIPFFLDMTFLQKLISIIIFIICQFLWTFLQVKASQISVIQNFVTKCGIYVVPIVFILLGILIIFGI